MSAERYWELRWRDEHAANEGLRDTVDRLRAALTLFLATDQAMEGILWGKEPDTALVKISIPLGQYREARKALSLPNGEL